MVPPETPSSLFLLSPVSQVWAAVADWGGSCDHSRQYKGGVTEDTTGEYGHLVAEWTKKITKHIPLKIKKKITPEWTFYWENSIVQCKSAKKKQQKLNQLGLSHYFAPFIFIPSLLDYMTFLLKKGQISWPCTEIQIKLNTIGSRHSRRSNGRFSLSHPRLTSLMLSWQKRMSTIPPLLCHGPSHDILHVIIILRTQWQWLHLRDLNRGQEQEERQVAWFCLCFLLESLAPGRGGRPAVRMHWQVNDRSSNCNIQHFDFALNV